MNKDRSPARGRDLQRELLFGGPVLGRGEAPDGSWELRALYEAPDAGSSRSLYLYVELWNDRRQKIGGGGCGGLGLANDQRPLVVSMSRCGPRASFCYVGQVMASAEHVHVDLSDGSVSEAVLMAGEIPVKLWMVFTHGTAVPVRARALANGAQIAATPIPEEWPEPRSNACWGPVDDE